MSKKIYIVLHHEIFFRGDYVDDEMVFQVCSSLPKAIEYIRSARVDPYSWWEIQESTLDNGDWPVHVGWYGLRGGKLRKAPFEKAVKMYKKCKNDPTHHLNA